jgi:ribosomal protein L9
MKQKDQEEKEKDPLAYAKKWKEFMNEQAILIQERTKEHKELHDSIQITDEMYRKRFTI